MSGVLPSQAPQSDHRQIVRAMHAPLDELAAASASPTNGRS
ncbi:MAG TPA: hypothetical protein VL917_04915 [Sphingomicrobium sp.]|nr:hypothetical protein [Sphingomicrobium sp.]